MATDLDEVKSLLGQAILKTTKVQYNNEVNYDERLKRLLKKLNSADENVVSRINRMNFGREEAMCKYKIYALLRIFSDINDKESVCHLLEDCYNRLGLESIFNIKGLMTQLSTRIEETFDDLNDFIPHPLLEVHSNLGKSEVDPEITLELCEKHAAFIWIHLFKNGNIQLDYTAHLLDKGGGEEQLAINKPFRGLEVKEEPVVLSTVVADAFKEFRILKRYKNKNHEQTQRARKKSDTSSL